MAAHIDGPLYYEKMGRKGPVIAFVHPNPMDQSCWIFQMAHLSTWYRCIAIDIPGYGRSPKAQDGLTMADMAQACWEAIDAEFPGENCDPGRLLRGLLHRPAHVSSQAGAHRRDGFVGHGLQPGERVHEAPHPGLHGAGNRVSLGLHV